MSTTNKLLTALLFTVAFAPSPVRASEPEIFRIGVCLSLTGDYATLGNTYLAGVRIGAEDFNRRGSVTGIRLELLERDDRSDPEHGAAMARELADAGVLAIIGSNSTDVTLAMLDVANQIGVPLVTPSASSNRIGDNNDVGFRVLFGDDFQGIALARFGNRNLKLQRAAVLVNKRASYGRALVSAFTGIWEALGGELVADEVYDLDSPDADNHDFRPLLRKMKNANPELVVIPGDPDEITAILRQSLEVEFMPVFCGGDTWQHESVLYASGNYLAGCYHIGYLDENANNSEMFTFMELLDSSNYLSAEPASVLGYDALELIITALLRGGRDREGIIEGLYSIRNFPLASGDITIDREAGTKKPAYIMQFVKGPRGFHREVVDVILP